MNRSTLRLLHFLVDVRLVIEGSEASAYRFLLVLESYVGRSAACSRLSAPSSPFAWAFRRGAETGAAPRHSAVDKCFRALRSVTLGASLPARRASVEKCRQL